MHNINGDGAQMLADTIQKAVADDAEVLSVVPGKELAGSTPAAQAVLCLCRAG